jgi:hypothetical protein
MSLNENVRAAILRIADVSKNARVIASRLGLQEGQRVTAAEVTDVDQLKKQVETLNAKLADLRLFITTTELDDEVQLNQAQVDKFIADFAASLGTQAFSVISDVYDEDYFLDYSRRMRFEIATVLVNWCQERKFAMHPLWYKIMVNNGNL